MLHLHTGVPGHGKTLYTLEFVEKFKTNQKDEKDNPLPDREVFYHNINKLTLDWTHFEDPEKWYDLPHDAIIVIDEAQEFFPMRQGKEPVPEKCQRFERHRHTGWDIILVTQHPKFLDVHLRPLAGKHRHIERKLGLQKATLYQNDKSFDPDNYFDKDNAQKSLWSYPKKYFDVYKSATKHTVKKAIPKWLYLIPLLIIAIFSSLYYVFNAFSTESPGQVPQALKGVVPEVATMKSNYTYAQQMMPELSDMPQSSTYYRPVYKPVTYPRPQCLANADRTRCECYSQQITKMFVSMKYCLHVVDNGIFDPTQEDKQAIKRRGQ
jgi:zona occludens toxin (predicted ATPase)